MNTIKFRLTRSVSLLSVGFSCFFIFLAACSEPIPPEQRVAEKAVERWQALINNKLEDAYSFLSPSYRQAVPLAMYQSRLANRAVEWHDAKVASVSCEQESCEVAMLVSYGYNNPHFEQYENQRTLKERWIFADDDWWYYQKG